MLTGLLTWCCALMLVLSFQSLSSSHFAASTATKSLMAAHCQDSKLNSAAEFCCLHVVDAIHCALLALHFWLCVVVAATICMFSRIKVDSLQGTHWQSQKCRASMGQHGAVLRSIPRALQIYLLSFWGLQVGWFLVLQMCTAHPLTQQCFIMSKLVHQVLHYVSQRLLASELQPKLVKAPYMSAPLPLCLPACLPVLVS